MMGEKKTPPIIIDEVQYDQEDLTQEQLLIVRHILDLDRKIESAQFNIDQLRVGKEAFLNELRLQISQDKSDSREEEAEAE